MPRRKKQVGRVGLCNCGQELEKKGVSLRCMCDGTKYVTERTCRNHRKRVIEYIRKKLKNARRILEEEPVLLPKFINKPENECAQENVQQGPSLMIQSMDYDEGGWCDDYSNGLGDGSNYIPSNGPAQSGNCNDSNSMQDTPDSVSNSPEGRHQSSANERELCESSGEEDISADNEVQMGLNDSMRAFTRQEVLEEFCEYNEASTDAQEVQKALEGWLDRCQNNIYPGSEKTVGQRIAQGLKQSIKQASPIGHVWEQFDLVSDDFSSALYPTSKEVQALIRKLGLGFKLEVTCEHHHPAQPGKKRGQLCGHVENEGVDACCCPLKIGIRSSTIQDFVRTQLLDPTFGSVIRECNARWNVNTPPGDTDVNRKLDCIFEGQFYRDTATKYPAFFYGRGHEKLHFALFVDGFQPFEGVNYTLFAVILICLNLPPETRMKPENLHILKLIDGPKEPRNFQQYLVPIVDELAHLWERGMKAYDASQKRTVQFKAMLACCIQDGRASMACSCQSEAGHYQGCRVCTLSGTYARGVHYVGNRRMLPKGHPYRNDPEFGPPTAVECKSKSHEFIMSRMNHLEKYPHHHDIPGMLGVKGVSQFKRLPYFDLGRCHILCFMHSIMNFGTLYITCEEQIGHNGISSTPCSETIGEDIL